MRIGTTWTEKASHAHSGHTSAVHEHKAWLIHVKATRSFGLRKHEREQASMKALRSRITAWKSQ